MKKRKILPLFCLFLFAVFNLRGISFSDLKISNDNRLLFKTVFDSQHAVFVSPLGSPANNPSIRQLTAFPEKLHIADNGRLIIAVNRFGAGVIPITGGLPAPVPGFPSFADGDIPSGGRLQELAASPDGRWIIYLEPVSHAFGNLQLIDITTGAKRLISERVELPAGEFPVKWSPDSKYFVYSKNAVLYYFPIVGNFSALVSERFRIIGAGEINSVLWGQDEHFFFLRGNTLYRIINPELFTRTIYGDFLSIGDVAAVFPFEFDPLFDKFWIAPDSGSILICKDNRTFFIFLLGDDYSSSVLPYAVLPFGTENVSALWSPSGRLCVIASVRNDTAVWRFDIAGRQIRNLTLNYANAPASPEGALSPDGTRAVFWGENGLELWDFANWRLIQRISREPVYSCAWINNSQFVSGNARFIEEVSVSGTNVSRRRICLSGADEFGFELNSRSPSLIMARVGTEWFSTDGISQWTAAGNPELQQDTLSAERYRVFLEPMNSGPFSNMPMIRSADYGTMPLFSGYNAGSFTAARRTQIALCFDLYDDDTGLVQVLAALRRRNIKATFFLNGDFIRRSPLGAAAIAQAGHEAASMFYAPIDFSDSRYIITPEFIVQGLARNEDEFNIAARSELSLLWHLPFYRNSAVISAAAASARYATVVPTFDPGGWLSREEELMLGLNRISSPQMIEQIIENAHDGAIIPVRLGLLPGGRDDYLFRHIEVLLDALDRCGIEIVPVSAVINR